MNKPQLSQSIKTYYGYDPVLSGDYLEKFVDFTVHLSTNRDEYDFERVIRNQLFRVGELESLEHTNEFFVWAL